MSEAEKKEPIPYKGKGQDDEGIVYEGPSSGIKWPELVLAAACFALVSIYLYWMFAIWG
jgi:hypothetical protein